MIDDMELWQIAVELDLDIGDAAPVVEPQQPTSRGRPPTAQGRNLVRHGAGAQAPDVRGPSRPALIGVE